MRRNSIVKIPGLASVARYLKKNALRPDLPEDDFTRRFHGLVTGDVNLGREPFLRGWIAKIGDPGPRVGVATIDGEAFEVVCDVFREDLLAGNINQGRHAFEARLPETCLDGREHALSLRDRESGKIVFERVVNWRRERPYADFSGFLAHSLVDPVMYGPFGELDEAILATMDHIAAFLARIAARLPEKPLVSVIMPVHNRAATVGESIASVLAQEYGRFELLVVDDGSTDGSRQAVAAFSDPRIIVLSGDVRRGPSHARNQGLARARGDYVAYLDSDNTWSPRYLSAMVGAFAHLPEARCLYSGQHLYKKISPKPFAVRFGSANPALLRNQNFIDLNAYCHHRSLFETRGGFDESLRRFVDYELILRYGLWAKTSSVPVVECGYHYDKADNTLTMSNAFSEDLARIHDRYGHAATPEAVLTLTPGQESGRTRPARRLRVIIPAVGKGEALGECLEAMCRVYDTDRMEIVVVADAACRDAVAAFRDRTRGARLTLVEHAGDGGFFSGLGRGLRHASEAPEAPEGTDALVLSVDMRVTPGMVEGLGAVAAEVADCAMVVPQRVRFADPAAVEDVPFADPGLPCDRSLSAKYRNAINVPAFHDGELVELNFAPLCCAYLTGAALTKLVDFDFDSVLPACANNVFCDHVRMILRKKIFYTSKAVAYQVKEAGPAVTDMSP